MALNWVLGPPGSGKTHALILAARAAATAGRRVRWLGLPTQRAHVLRRLVEAGPLLGVEVITLQQLAYAVLAADGAARHQLVGTARLALVAEALLARDGMLPTPGEASLFAAGIAEAKRYGLGPAALARTAAGGARGVAGVAGEIDRLADVFAAYERLKGDDLDYDDVRREAWQRTAAAPMDRLATLVGADVVLVDGVRELAPDDLAWLQRLSDGVEVWLSASLPPPPAVLAEAANVRVLQARPNDVQVWRFDNTVAEVRGVLRALARDLAQGADPRDLAVVAPSGSLRALRALAGEFGVALSEETPRALVDLPLGRRLADLLDLPVHPTAGRLLAVPALAPIGRRALREGMAGVDAVGRLAVEEGLDAVWRDWQTALTPGADPLAWARRVVALAGDLVREAETGAPDPASGAADASSEAAARPSAGDPGAIARAQEAALRRAQEAARLARAAVETAVTDGTEPVQDGGFRAWWLALLRASSLRERPRPGVALLSPTEVAGRRFRRAYVLGAVAGAYDAGESEDYFVPEDGRVPVAALVRPHAEASLGTELPRRYRGLDPWVRAELRARADEVILSHADGDRAGPLRPDEALLGCTAGQPPPAVATSSPLEARPSVPFVAVDDVVDGGRVGVEGLRRAHQCAFQVWATPLAEDDPRAPWPVRARRALTATETLSSERRRALEAASPLLAPWFERHGDALGRLRFGVRLEDGREGATTRLDAVAREDGVVRIVRFLLPDEDPRDLLRPDRRWSELWAADVLRRRYPRQAARVEIVAWPLGGDALPLTPDGVDTRDLATKRRRVRDAVDVAGRRWRAQPPRPSPGFRCGSCPVIDVCRPSQTSSEDGWAP